MVDHTLPTPVGGCGLLKPFGTMRWYHEDSLQFAREERDTNRVACGGHNSRSDRESSGIRLIKLCRTCAVEAGAEW